MRAGGLHSRYLMRRAFPCRVGEDAAQQHHQRQQHTMSGGGRWAARPALFTAAQYEELEHQALIYKYLVAGVPVPPDLLLPLRRGFVYDHPSRKHGLRIPSHARVTLFYIAQPRWRRSAAASMQ